MHRRSPPRLVSLGTAGACVCCHVLANGCGRFGYEGTSGGAGGVSWTDAGSSGAAAGSSNADASEPGAGGTLAGNSGGATSGGGNSTTKESGGATDASTGSGGAADARAPFGGAMGSGGVMLDGGRDGCVVGSGGFEVCNGLDDDCNGTIDDANVCGARCLGATYGGHAYAFCANPLPFDDAETACESKFMRLARLDSGPETEFLASLAFANAAGSDSPTIWPWFGARSQSNPVQWVYMDGSVLWTGTKNGSAPPGIFTNWSSTSPGDTTGTTCASFRNAPSHRWVEQSCTSSQPYLCEKW